MRIKNFGKHWLIEFSDCSAEKLMYLEDVQEIFLEAAKESNATILNYFFHQFNPYGVSGVILISESHFSIHTWPESCYAAVDIFTCGAKMDANIGIEILRRFFEAKKIKIRQFSRGF